MQGKKAIVTGAAGFIGSHVVDELLNQHYTVVALDDLSGGFVDNVNSRATFTHGSVNDVSLIVRLFAEHRFDYVFHLAAYAAEGLSHFIRRFNYENNLIGSVNLINAAVNHDVKCFVFASSTAAYGRNQVPMTEEEDRLLRMATWVRSKGARQSKGFGTLDITRKLPSSWRKL